MRKLTFGSMVLTLGALCLVVLTGMVPTASANQITLGNSSQLVTFTGDGGGVLDLTLGTCVAGTCTLSGNAIGTDGEAGTYSFVTTVGTDNPDFGPNNGFGVFPLLATDGTTTVFNFIDTVDGDSNLTNIPITYVLVANGTSNPHLEFTTPFGTGDFITSTVTCGGVVGACNIDNAANGGTASATISSGQVVVPEPASLLLLGTGLLSFGGLCRRRILGA